jgi:hypothetical protein
VLHVKILIAQFPNCGVQRRMNIIALLKVYFQHISVNSHFLIDANAIAITHTLRVREAQISMTKHCANAIVFEGETFSIACMQPSGGDDVSNLKEHFVVSHTSAQRTLAARSNSPQDETR